MPGGRSIERVKRFVVNLSVGFIENYHPTDDFLKICQNEDIL